MCWTSSVGSRRGSGPIRRGCLDGVADRVLEAGGAGPRPRGAGTPDAAPGNSAGGWSIGGGGRVGNRSLLGAARSGAVADSRGGAGAGRRAALPVRDGPVRSRDVRPRLSLSGGPRPGHRGAGAGRAAGRTPDCLRPDLLGRSRAAGGAVGMERLRNPLIQRILSSEELEGLLAPDAGFEIIHHREFRPGRNAGVLGGGNRSAAGGGGPAGDRRVLRGRDLGGFRVAPGDAIGLRLAAGGVPAAPCGFEVTVRPAGPVLNNGRPRSRGPCILNR